MKNFIRYLNLIAMLTVISVRHCYCMEDVRNLSNKQNNNSTITTIDNNNLNEIINNMPSNINNIINNHAFDNSKNLQINNNDIKTNITSNKQNLTIDDYCEKIFEENYNKEYCNKLSDKYSYSARHTTPEYESFIYYVNAIFKELNEILGTNFPMDDSNSSDYEMCEIDDSEHEEFMKTITIPAKHILKFESIFNKFSKSQNSMQFQEYINNKKENITFKQLYNYLKNKINELQVNTLEKLAESVSKLKDNNENLNKILLKYEQERDDIIIQCNNEISKVNDEKKIEDIKDEYEKKLNKINEKTQEIILNTKFNNNLKLFKELMNERKQINTGFSSIFNKLQNNKITNTDINNKYINTQNVLDNSVNNINIINNQIQYSKEATQNINTSHINNNNSNAVENILPSHNEYWVNNLNSNQTSIIKKSQKTLDEVINELKNIFNGFGNLDNGVFNLNSKNISLEKMLQDFIYNCNSCKTIVNCFDKLYYNGSKLQDRFNNLHSHVISILQNIIDNELNNKKLFNEKKVTLPSDITIFENDNLKYLDEHSTYKLLLEDKNEDSIRLRELLVKLLFPSTTKKIAKEEYLLDIMEIMNITKKLIDNKIQERLVANHNIITNRSVGLDTMQEDAITSYIHVFDNLMQHAILNIKNLRLNPKSSRNEKDLFKAIMKIYHNPDKKLMYCNDLVLSFLSLYNGAFLPSLKKCELNYEQEQFAHDNLEKLLDSKSIELDGIDSLVNNMKIKDNSSNQEFD